MLKHKTKIVGILAFLLSTTSFALVPVEGIIMGEANQDFQLDPLNFIFKDVRDKSQEGENKKVRTYFENYLSAEGLLNSCEILKPSEYSSPRQEVQAKRSVAASLQYLGLDLSIKAIGAYAKKLNVGEEEFSKLTNNLVTNYCSKNITVMSLRSVKASLGHYYKNVEEGIIPSVDSSPHATLLFKSNTEKTDGRSKEFSQVIKNFRAFCSWGGSPEDYRLLNPYLKNPIVMSQVMKKMLLSDVKVSCVDQICRPMNAAEFEKNFPLSRGSTGVKTDFSKLYCHHFRFQDQGKNKSIPEVSQWIKGAELEDPILETSQFISLLTGVPDLFFGVTKFNDIPVIVKSSIDERWNKWAKEVLGSFSKDLLFEESLKVKALPRRSVASLALDGFQMHFSVTLGEMDRLMDKADKLETSFDLKLSKNYLRGLRTKWDYLTREVDEQGQKEFKEEIARYVELHLKPKEKLFNQKMWNSTFSKLIAEELLAQSLAYRGPLFNSLKEEMLTVPVKFSYGLFALSYLRYRADVTNGRLKLTL